MTTDIKGRVVLGPIEKAIAAIVVSVICAGVPAIVYVLWDWRAGIAAISARQDYTDKRLERIENTLDRIDDRRAERR